MISAYKLYKHDAQHQRTAVTWGPKGKPVSTPKGPGRTIQFKGKKPMINRSKCGGSVCYNHYNVDWTVHRLTPTVLSKHPKLKERTAKVVDKYNNHGLEKKEQSHFTKRERAHIDKHLANSSPRWGEGDAPGRRPRAPVPLPHHSDIQVSKGTKVAVGGAAVTYGGYKAYQHRGEIKQKAQNFGTHVHNSFHNTRQAIGAHT